MTMATITTLTNEENQFYLSYQLFRGNKMKSKEKIVLGQFFTKENSWLKTQVVEFIIKFDCKTAFDPFAGGGHLLESAKKLGIKNGDKILFMEESGRIYMMNSSMDALREAQKAFAGEAERVGLKDDDDVMAMIKELRKQSMVK